ncbi:hypothetical protein LCGC14_0908290 [marine sediment metagenome]|uniref:Uncharacterized protein n=1 Tax=marine sediment metagenome TaxID=412755 RepID=A0A0F9PF45_9ZZZZ
MPWLKISEAPANIRKLNGVSLTLGQVNWIANVADGIPEEQVDSPWAVAIAQFKRAHRVGEDKWIKKSKEEKELSYIIKKLGLGQYTVTTDDAFAIIEKNDSGTYNIMTVSTAAVEDREGETFTVECMDYDHSEAKRLNDYPEYRVFHSKYLGVGRVEKMWRVGIIAIDSGKSYDDPFSLSVCEKMLANNDGRWRVSRGFRVFDLSGSCPQCNDLLSISTKHMLAGFRCPSCRAVHLRFKGVLGGIQFKKARTFDITVTDVPAVPYTGAFAWRAEDIGGISMNKKELKKRLLDAGIPEDMIESRLKGVTDDQLKEFDDIPEAELLKEFKGDDSDDVVLEYDEFVNVIKQVVHEEIESALDGFQISVEGFELETELKEDDPVIVTLKEDIGNLEDKIDSLLEADEDRLKHILNETSRSGKIHIARMKGKKKVEDDDDDEEEDEDEVPLSEQLKDVSPEVLAWMKQVGEVKAKEGQIQDAEGNVYPSMTALVHDHPSE